MQLHMTASGIPSTRKLIAPNMALHELEDGNLISWQINFDIRPETIFSYYILDSLIKSGGLLIPKAEKYAAAKIRNVIFTIYLDAAVASNFWAPCLKTYILDLYHTKTNRFTIYHRSDIRKTFWSAIKILFMKIIERDDIMPHTLDNLTLYMECSLNL